MKRETHHSNDNEPMTFSKLGLAAALIVNRLRNDSLMRGVGETADRAGDTGKKDADDEKQRYIDQRLRELAAFERRADGLKRR